MVRLNFYLPIIFYYHEFIILTKNRIIWPFEMTWFLYYYYYSKLAIPRDTYLLILFLSFVRTEFVHSLFVLNSVHTIDNCTFENTRRIVNDDSFVSRYSLTHTYLEFRPLTLLNKQKRNPSAEHLDERCSNTNNVKR